MQTHYINSLLNKFGHKNVNPVTTPLNPNVNLDDNETEEDSNIQDNQASHSYATLISSLMYLALGTWPDIAYAINRLAQFTQELKPKHWTAIKQVFCYPKGTRNNTLTYGGVEELLNKNLNIFCDAD